MTGGRSPRDEDFDGGFNGAKLVLIGTFGRCPVVLTYLRDDRPDLPFPGLWDLPGGGREGQEAPEACALRELHEEFGLELPAARLLWHREIAAQSPGHPRSHVFGAELMAREAGRIRFGDEGQDWRLMPLTEFLAHPGAVPHLQAEARGFAADFFAQRVGTGVSPR